MQAAQFEYLWLHAHHLAEQALQQIGAEIMALPDAATAADDLSHLSDAEREARAVAQLGALDLSGFQEGLPWGVQNEAGLHQALHSLQLEQDAAALAADGTAEPMPGETDEAQLQQAYAGLPALQARIGAEMARANLSHVQALLNQDQDLHALCAPLTAVDFAGFLLQYQCADPALSDLVTYLCSLEFLPEL